jgi:hypothetical protein
MFPLLFCGVAGQDYHEIDSPGVFNPAEARKVVALVEALLRSPRVKVSTNDFGVITPYRKQVLKLRKLFRKVGLTGIRVGSVHDYQGQEERITIISTVLSSSHAAEVGGGGGGGGGGSDAGGEGDGDGEGDAGLLRAAPAREHHAGLMSNSKRFNVALTRAQALTIVVGNPAVLCHSANWRACIRFCVEHNAYRGVDFPQLREFRGAAAAGSDGDWYEEAQDGDEEDDLGWFVDRATETALGAAPALLGAMYPESPEDVYRAQMGWRRLGL